MSPPVSMSAPSVAGESPAGRRPRRGLSAHERWLVALVAANLLLLPWAFGGVDPWSQAVAAGLAALALGVALGRSPDSAGSAWARLRRFPVFWAGLALAAYGLAQAANPAFVHHVDGRYWWLEPAPHAGWLPAGMVVPFAEAGPWRQLLLWGAPWATACALWAGLTRATAVLALLNVVAANGFLLAAFGLVQLAAGQGDVFGVRHVESAEIFASFIYRNHAAAYFHLAGPVAVALALHGLWGRSTRAAAHGPAVLHFFFAVTAVAAIVLTSSFGGLLLLAGWSLPAAGAAWVILRRRGRLARPGPGAGLAAVVLALVAGLAAVVGQGPLRTHLAAKVGGGAARSLHIRLLAAKQGLAMLAERPLAGWGAGCFRYGFPKFQRRELEITGTGIRRQFWEHLHNDWLEFAIELGAAGLVPVGIIAGSWVRQLARLRVWRQPHLLWAAAGPALVAAYALLDFPLQNSAVLLTGACLLCLATRWAELAAPPPAAPSPAL